MKYISFGYFDPALFAAMTEAEQQAMIDECFGYDEYLRENGHFGVGEALQLPENSVTLYWKNGKVATTDGPFTETKETIGGFFVLEARDMNHAVQLMSQHPALKYGSSFELRPVQDMDEVVKASEERRRKAAAG